MAKIVVASTNPVKLQAARLGFQAMFPAALFSIQAVDASSGVRDQPLSSAETLQGALNRAQAAARLEPQADYWVGIEGGVEELGQELAAFAWVVVHTPRLTGKGRSGTFFLPPAIAALVRQGVELGQADDIVFNKTDSKRQNGAIGILTADVINRTQLYEHAVILALVPFKNEDLYLS